MSRIAAALTVVETVSPGYLTDHPKDFIVSVEKRDDGLIHFKITQNLQRPSYLVATAEIRMVGKVVSSSTSCSYARENSATYYLAIAPDQIPDAKFTIFQGSFIESGGQPEATVGGLDFQFELAEFAKTAKEIMSLEGEKK